MSDPSSHRTPHLVGIGGAHVDRIAQLIGPHKPETSNPVTMQETIGGGVFNALRAASARKAGRVSIISARGGDIAANAVSDAVDAAGISDLSGVFLDRATPSYTAILDGDGNLVTAVADMALYETGLARHIRRKPLRQAIAAADAVLIDANLAAISLSRIADDATGRLFAMAISAAKVTRLRAVLPRIDILFLNHHELQALAGETGDTATRARAIMAEGDIGALVVTEGVDRVLVVEDGNTAMLLPVAVPVTNVTGAGDALAGATIAALLRAPALALTDAVCQGMAAAALTVQTHAPVSPHLAGPHFDAMLRQIRHANAMEPEPR